MIGYRSIGFSEFNMLVKAQNPIYGKQCWKGFDYNSCDVDYGVVCFFQEPYRWKDKQHQFDIQVELKNPILGTGKYMAAKSFGETRVWTGREGKTEYMLPEAYVRCYFPEQIKSIDIHGVYTNTFVREKIIPFCEKYGVKLLRDGKEIGPTSD